MPEFTLVPQMPRVFHCPNEQRWLPVSCLRPAFYRTNNFIRHPATVKTTWLRSHTLTIDSAIDHLRVKRKCASYHGKLGQRVFVAPPHHTPRIISSQRPVSGQALPFARRVARNANEFHQIDINGRKVKRRRTRRLQNSERRSGTGNQHAGRPNIYAPSVRHDTWRAGIVPDRLLPFHGCNGKVRPLLAAVIP